ncbi:hypothetical protein CANINC_002494 [Pichia inconspicua]|uniref:DUF155 domain-containing protein n=1 Tax=Pichia inconspicua TaxID=52247 RepID=A0A4T0X0V7_9ASCO|nr:hypothetical protein CANINC_002494 [[Candida] inconspicua]
MINRLSNLVKTSQSNFGFERVCFGLCGRRSYTQPGSNSVASQQRKKVLTYQTTPPVNADILAGSETLIHPAFVTRSNLTTYLDKLVKPVVSVTKAESYNLEEIKQILVEKKINPIQIVPGECLTFKWTNNQEVFVFKFGTIVAWNVNELEVVEKILPLFESAEITPYKYQSEDLDFVELECKDEEKCESYVAKENEIICLKAPTPQQRLLDMLAFSYGISRSTRLAILEEAVETHIQTTKSTIDKLADGEKIAVNSKDTLRLSGRLLLLRGKLNLYSELVETPDIYWSESRLERIHDRISNALDIAKRVNILNRKLDYLTEESEALISVISKRTEVNLELIIIYLIMIEVAFELYHFYERLGGQYSIEYFREKLHGTGSPPQQ